MKSIFRIWLLLFISWNAHAALTPILLSGDVQVDVCEGAACTGSNVGVSNTSRSLTADPAGNVYMVFFKANVLSVAKSTNQGASFLERVNLPAFGGSATTVAAASIRSSSSGIVYVFAILNNGEAYVSRSLNQGVTWSDPNKVGAVSSTSSAIGMATFGKYVYLMGAGGGGFQLFRSDDEGLTFATTNVAMSVAFGNVMVDRVNGDVYIAADTPAFQVRKSTDFGKTFGPVINPPGQAYFSSWALAHEQDNTYLYAVGSLIGSSGDPGYKVNINSNTSVRLNLDATTVANSASVFSDDFGNALYVYKTNGGGIAFQNSNDFFTTFNASQTIVAQANNQTAVINPQTGNIHIAYITNSGIKMNTYGSGAVGYDVSVEPRFLDFGNKRLASVSSLPVTIKNNGKALAILSDFVAGPGYSVNSHCQASLAADSSCVVDVTFTPTSQGVTSSELTFTANGVTLQIPLLGKVAAADVSITKTDGITSVAAGGSLTYTITVSNAGPDTASGTTVSDTLPASLTNAVWTCVGNAGGICTPSGVGSINDSINLAVGGSVTYTLNATVDLAASGTISNTAVVANSAEIVDPRPENNSATDTDAVIAASFNVVGAADPVDAGAVTCSGPVGFGGTINCSAQAVPGYTFEAFAGDCEGNVCTINNVQSNKMVIARFSPTLYSVTGVVNPLEAGTVTCTTSINHGGSSTCTAIANPGYTFASFSGDCSGSVCTIDNIQSDKTAVATFTRNFFVVTGSATPANGGQVACTGPIAYGDTSVCTATPAPGFELVGFQGDCTGKICTVENIQGDKSVTAKFAMRSIISKSSTDAVVSASLITASSACEFDPENTGPFTPAVAYEGNSVFAQGGFKFKLLNCEIGEKVKVAVTFPSLEGMGAKKFGPTPTSSGKSIWYDPMGLTISGNTITYELTDGGLGDDNIVADGVINDPIVPVPLPAPAAVAQPVPSLSQWALWILSLLIAVVAVVRHRKQSSLA